MVVYLVLVQRAVHRGIPLPYPPESSRICLAFGCQKDADQFIRAASKSANDLEVHIRESPDEKMYRRIVYDKEVKDHGRGQ
jgi:hypothetical protein